MFVWCRIGRQVLRVGSRGLLVGRVLHAQTTQHEDTIGSLWEHKSDTLKGISVSM
jgi:hypothetical protein